MPQLTHHRYLTALATAACAAGALLAGGCGSSGKSHSSKSSSQSTQSTSAGTTGATGGATGPIVQAAAASIGQPGVKVTMKMKLSASALGGTPIDVTGGGSFATASKTGQFSFSMDLSAIPGASLLLGSTGALTFQEINKGTTIYLKFPSTLSAMLGGGKPWVKFDAAQLAGSKSSIASLFSSPASTNPAGMLQYLEGVAGSVKTVGPATINGVQTTEYQGEVSPAALQQKLKALEPATAQQVISELESMTGGKAFPIDVWIDGQHLVRQIEFNVTGTSALSADLTIDFPDYGTQPAPAIPPASEVGDGSTLLNAASALTGGSSGTSTSSAIP